MILRPGDIYTITRVLKDHTDTTTRYVQAVIKHARTRVTLGTINLTDRGNRYFSKDWSVLSDAAGHFTIIIITSVYDDSGYTTKSLSYEEESTEILIDESFGMNFGGGGNGVDYKIIKKMMQEVVDGIQFPETPEPKETDLTPVLQAVSTQGEAITKAIDSIEPSKPLDLSPIQAKLNDIYKCVEKIKPTEKTELGPVLNEIQALSVVLSVIVEHLQKSDDGRDDMKEGLTQELRDYLDEKLHSTLTLVSGFSRVQEADREKEKGPSRDHLFKKS